MTAAPDPAAPPPCLWTHTAWHPGYRATVSIDAFAPDAGAALRSLRRFVDRENRRLARAGLPRRARLRRPSPLTIRREAPPTQP